MRLINTRVVKAKRGGWSEGAHPRDSKGRFAPKRGGRGVPVRKDVRVAAHTPRGLMADLSRRGWHNVRHRSSTGRVTARTMAGGLELQIEDPLNAGTGHRVIDTSTGKRVISGKGRSSIPSARDAMMAYRMQLGR